MTDNDEAVDISQLLGAQGIRMITMPHEQSDVILVCCANPQRSPGREVEFHCHHAVLGRRCSLFANMLKFEGFTGSRQSQRVHVPGYEDIVFEVLRYIYCGSFFFRHDFRPRFPEFLKVVDYLGVEEMAERECMDGSGEASVLSIFADLGLQQWLQDMDTERLHNLLRDDNLVGTPTHGTGAVGFSMRRGLAAKLAELRPQDLTEEALGEDLTRRLVGFHSSTGDNTSNGRLLLPGQVLFVNLDSGGLTRQVYLNGTEVIHDAARLDERPGRLWHGGHLLEPMATRQTLQTDGTPRTLIVFHESFEGQRAFDATMRRARSRALAEQGDFLRSLEGFFAVQHHPGMLRDDLAWMLLHGRIATDLFPPKCWTSEVLSALPFSNLEWLSIQRVPLLQCLRCMPRPGAGPWATSRSSSATQPDQRPSEMQVSAAPLLLQSSSRPGWTAPHEGSHVDVVVLGCLGVEREELMQLMQASPGDGLLWELRRAVEAVNPSFQDHGSPLVAAVLRHSGAGDSQLPPGSDDLQWHHQDDEIGTGWLSGVVLGESVAQILFRWALEILKEDSEPFFWAMDIAPLRASRSLGSLGSPSSLPRVRSLQSFTELTPGGGPQHALSLTWG